MKQKRYTYDPVTKHYTIDRSPINGGRGTQPDYQRNEDLINDYKKKTPYSELTTKYGITSQMINKVLDSYGIPRNRKMKKRKKTS